MARSVLCRENAKRLSTLHTTRVEQAPAVADTNVRDNRTQLGYPSAAHEVDYQYDERNDEKQMNQTSGDVKAETE